MWILNRKDLREAIVGTCGAAAILVLGLYFKSKIETYIGETLTYWLLIGLLFICVLQVGNVIDGWRHLRDWERHERERQLEEERQKGEWEREEQEKSAEWNTFTNWVKQNPATAERLMLMVEAEQIDDAEYRARIAERRRTDGPNELTDLPRLFEWLKAQRDIRKLGLDSDLPPGAS